MGWDRRGYYYRVRKVGGRVVRDYVGTGRVAELAAQLDEIDRERRDAERASDRIQRAELAALDISLRDLNTQTDLLAEAALLAAGFHRHKRGEWRRRRGQAQEND